MAEQATLPLVGDVRRLLRYYGAGLVNTLVGYGLYAGFVALGFNIYVAQALGHVMGMTFNYFSYSRYAFRDEVGSKARFVASYAVNYVLGVTSLFISVRFIANPYLAGLLATLVVSLLNYFILSRYVFRPKKR
jgi:putative flippase GtrA